MDGCEGMNCQRRGGFPKCLLFAGMEAESSHIIKTTNIFNYKKYIILPNTAAS